jgi:hypothetical protein
MSLLLLGALGVLCAIPLAALSFRNAESVALVNVRLMPPLASVS